jgi:FkbH-like protein
MTLARELSASAGGLQPMRLVLLASFTTSLFDAFLKVEAARYGFDLSVHHGGFGQFEQALLQEDWMPEDDRPIALAIAMRLEDLDPDLAFRFYRPGRLPFDALSADVLQRIENTVRLFHDKARGPALVANFAPPEFRPLSVFEANSPDSLTNSILELNRGLLQRLDQFGDAFVWDYAGLVSSSGARSWTDARMWSLAKTAVAPANQPAFAAHLMRTMQGVMFPAAKCLVLDLDNTLWGGAVGDDGAGGIVVGDDYPGSAFKLFQRAILGLKDRGIILALCSKNDPEVVQEVFEKHPDMLLRSEDIAAQRINWLPKSDNIREIAEELNIGLDSLVFFDDNPVERAEVRTNLPEVIVVEVPTDPVLYVEALYAVADFDVPVLTQEDRGRAASYQAERLRQSSEQQAGSLDDFLESLDMRVEFGTLDATSSLRIAQLVAKTNQFNLTTRRRSQDEIEAIAAREDADVYWLRLTDRYADMGLIAVAIVIGQGEDLLIDSLILSCRAANRGIEQAMLAFISEEARKRGYARLVGEYVPTERNHVVSELYPQMRFNLKKESDGASVYSLELASEKIEFPKSLLILDSSTE